jgi:undecaprenyl-diphosphatase
MSLLTSIVLGLIQGIAEFLPISSSGHLAIAQNLLGMDSAGNVPEFFDVLLHLGTLLAVFVAYWHDIKEMVVEFFRGIGDLAHHATPSPVPPTRRLVMMVILGTLPLVLVLPFDDKIEALSSNMLFVGGALLFTGLLLFASDRVRRGRKDERSMTVLDVLAIGLSQAVATAPGISRSGMTISMGCFTGLDRKFAVRFSFLLSIPAVLGANLLSLVKAAKAGIIWGEVPIYLAGVLVAAVAGYLCIRLLRLVAEKGKFGYFAYYCWVVGVVVIVLSILF